MNDIMKIVQALEDSNTLLKGVTKTITNEIKEQKGGFLTRSGKGGGGRKNFHILGESNVDSTVHP